MSERLPSVSVVVATRDRLELLRGAVAAILAQKYEGQVECVLVFDQSEPAELEVEVPAGRSLKVVSNVRKPGLAGARNSGALAGNGELLAFCDDDDEWAQDKLAMQVAALEQEPSALVVTTGIEIAYETRRVQRIPAETRVTLQQLLRSRSTEVHPSTVLVRRDAFFGAIGPVDEDIPGSYGEDYEWLLRAAAAGPILAVRAPLVRVRWGATSYFADRWQTIIDAIAYLLDKHPELRSDRRNVARLYGRVAFAHAALGHGRQAWAWSLRSLKHNPLERRPYLALAVSLHLVGADRLQRMANRAGKGV